VKGKLKVFLGYAPGAGATYAMLEEAQGLKARGIDVVVGWLESRGRKDTVDQAAGIEGTGPKFNPSAIIKRKPAVCVVDELTARWRDVRLLIDNGIDVLTTVRVQNLESLNDDVARITGLREEHTLPDWVVDEADEVVMVDITPRALRNRVERGVVYPAGVTPDVTEDFFSESNLSALREIALRHTVHEVEERLTPEPVQAHGILVCLNHHPATAMLVRRGKRVADYLHARCIAVHITRDGEVSADVERHINFARNLRIETHIIKGENVAEKIVNFAREHGMTQIFLGRESRKRWAFQESTIKSVVRLAADMEVTIVAEHRR
jgi:two-component system sensor histidine kinase KdpD